MFIPSWFTPIEFSVNDFDVHALITQHAISIQHHERVLYFHNHKNPFHEDYNPKSTLKQVHEHVDDVTILINRFLTLPSTYVPSDLVDLKSLDATHPSSLLRSEAAHAFLQMRAAIKRDIQVSIEARSAYRSFKTQAALFKRYAEKDGVLKANTYSAIAGQSEHQSGLGVDIAQSDQSYLRFKSSKAYPYLKENAHYYGFIERYPQGKSHITGYIYEPWHWRYVGIELATKLKEQDLTLDEFWVRREK